METAPLVVDPLTQQLANLTMVGWIALIPIVVLLIPLGVLLIILMAQASMLLVGVLEFFPVARYEIYPILKNVRQITARAEALSEKAVGGVESVGRGYHKSIETAGRGFGKIRNLATSGIATSAAATLGGLGKGLWRALRPSR